MDGETTAEPASADVATPAFRSYLDEEIADTGVTNRMLEADELPITFEQLQAVSAADDDALLWYVFGKAVAALEGDFSLAQAETLSPTLQTTYGALWAETEILEGGFPQYFFNGNLELWPLQRNALQRLGLDQHVRLIEQAIDVLALADSAIDDRDRTFEELTQTYEQRAFDELDDSFFALEAHASVYDALADHLRDNLHAAHDEIDALGP